MASSTGRSVRRPSKPDAAAQPTAAAAVADREAVDAAAPAAALEQELDPVPEAPWVRGEEAPSVEERPRPRVDAGAPLSGGRRRRRGRERREATFLSARPARSAPDSALVRGVATAGVVGIATAVAAVMGALGAAGWLIGVVASLLTLALPALLWRSRVI